MQDITNPRVAEHTFKEVQALCIPFTHVNSTLRDMISIYAAPHIQSDTKKEILQVLAEHALPAEKLENTHFYVFGISAYSLFLQMIAKEDSFAEGTRTYTQSSVILYSDASRVSFGFCPTFTNSDKSFWDITATAYAKTFSKESLHILRVETKKVTFGKKPDITVDYCMFIPGGEPVPKVELEIKNQKNCALSYL